MTDTAHTPATRRVLIDSAAYLALVNPRDAHHAAARATWQRLTSERWTAVTTNFVVAEAHALLIARAGRHVAVEFLRHFDRGATGIVRATGDDENRARQIVFRYEDKDFSLTDAISFAVMERLHIGVAFTYDAHFAQFGWTVAQPESPS